jgi:RNA polymerase sigma factor (sigma-70 family)
LKTADLTATSPEATDERLVTAAQAGSPEAFAALFRRYRPEIARYASRILGDDARAEDVVQEAFLSALRGIGTLDRPAGFKPWLYRIAHNACIDQMRRRARAAEVSFDSNGIPPADEFRLFRQAPSNHAQVAQKEEFKHLRQALTDLPDSQAEILVLRELEGLSYDDIGMRMKISVSAVESLLFRARRGLRAEYGQISTGERCRSMRTVMAQTVEGIDRPKERRALVRHLHGCTECRRDAFVMGLGQLLEAERRGGVGAKLSRVAALLPLPGFLNRRSEETSRFSSEGGRISSETGQISSFGSAGTSFAGHAQATIAHVTATAGATVEHAATVIQKAAAVVAAAAVVGGGGFVAHETHTQPPSPPTTAAKRVAGAPAPGIVAARPGAVFTSPMPLSLAPLAGGPPAMVLAPATIQSATPAPQQVPADTPSSQVPPPTEPPAVESAAPVEPTVTEPPATSPDPEPTAEPPSEPPVVGAPVDPPPAVVDPQPAPPDPAPPADPLPPDTGGTLGPASDDDSGDTGGFGSLDSLSA